MVNYLYHLSGVLVVSAVVVLQFPATVAQIDVMKIATERTVKIISPDPLPNPSSIVPEFNIIGSGVIISRVNSANTYYVLTAKHVLPAPNEDKIETYDGEKHRIIAMYPIDKVDLVVLVFSTNKQYRTVELGNSDENYLPNESTIYIAGWHKSESKYIFTTGVISSRRTNKDGYNLMYKAQTQDGMSGGPVLDRAGRLVAIHGESDNFGFQRGIPINTFLEIITPEFKRVLGIPTTQPSTPGITPRPVPTTIPNDIAIIQENNINTTINTNQTISGSLSRTDPIDRITFGRFRDYRLTGVRPGQSVQINLESSAFDPSLQLLNAATGQLIDLNDDDRSRKRNSQLIFTMRSGVEYLIRVTTYYPNATGSYTLRTRIK